MWRLSINHEYFRKRQRGESCNHDLPVLEHDWDIGRGDSIVLSGASMNVSALVVLTNYYAFIFLIFQILQWETRLSLIFTTVPIY
jgi:hypothetical protein